MTGSAHCTLIPYWAERLGKTLRSGRTDLAARRSDLLCKLDGERVVIAGSAVLYLEGMIV